MSGFEGNSNLQDHSLINGFRTVGRKKFASLGTSGGYTDNSGNTIVSSAGAFQSDTSIGF